jgi:serine/threonine-protein kinase
MRRIEELYHSARELEPRERAAFLVAACKGDSTLQQEIESLLGEEGSLLDGPAWDHARSLLGGDALVAGTQLGPYRVIAALGSGGMGEVYRATDSRLGREVAIKVLASALSGNSEAKARFGREAKVIASLNHPNICGLYDVGPDYLVMELVPGPTLAERILRGPMPAEEAMAIARQIAQGLEAAHEKGIVHRDLKPANIKLSPQGVVKILDFGLATLAKPLPADDDPENSPTRTSTLSRTGVIMGTAPYIAPEQARGRAVDKRADIWAFGLVLYEMLTGKRLFAGETTAEILSAVLTKEPEWEKVPAKFRRLLRTCLQKDSQQRLRDIGDVWQLLEEVPPAISLSGSKWSLAAAAIFAIATVTAVALWAPWRSDRSAAEPVVRFSMDTAPAQMLGPEEQCCRPSYTSLALSPDGRTVVFGGVAASSNPVQAQLYKRTLDKGSAVGLAGTEGANQPFFSPDGEWVGFSAGGKLKKVSLAGGPPVTICDVPADAPHSGIWGASWSTNGAIVFAHQDKGLMDVPSSGGTPKLLAQSSQANLYSAPEFLPDGKTVLLTLRTSDWESAQIVARRVDTGEQRVLLKGGASARYVPTGHLVYLQSGVLMAIPFDARRLQLTGPPVALIDGVMQSINMDSVDLESGIGQFAISRSGNLIYADGGVHPLFSSTLVRVDRKGVATPLNAPSAKPYAQPRLSPDGSRLAVSVQRENIAADIWVLDPKAKTGTRLTSHGINFYPLWSPDGKRILYSGGSGRMQLLEVPSDGSGGGEPVMSGLTLLVPASWPAEGLPLVYLAGQEHWEIWSRPMSRAGKPKRFLETGFQLPDAELSADGRWIAYVSNESGAEEIYVQAFPGPGEKHRISTAGGLNPAWARNGRELFYLEPQASGSVTMMAVDFAAGSAFHAGAPHTLFEGHFRRAHPRRNYDVDPDGQHFIMLRPAETLHEEHVSRLNVVLHWSEELKRRAPAK